MCINLLGNFLVDILWLRDYESVTIVFFLIKNYIKIFKKLFIIPVHEILLRDKNITKSILNEKNRAIPSWTLSIHIASLLSLIIMKDKAVE